MAGYKVFFGEESFDMIAGAYMVMDDYVQITIPGDGIGLDYLEEVLRNKDNLKSVRIYDGRPELVVQFDQYTEFGGLEKDPHYELQKYDGEGKLAPIFGDAIRITIRKPQMIDKFNKLEATMEYIAIMADIDIDEEE